MSDDEYHRSLPASPAAAALLITDQDDRVLLVQPAYKQGWEFPGGVVEAGETPAEAAAREIKEELGLALPVASRLLCVDWMRTQPGEPGGPRMIFDGGVLTREDQAEIRLPPDELKAWALVASGDADQFLPPERARRLTAAMTARTLGTGPAYLENGLPLT